MYGKTEWKSIATLQFQVNWCGTILFLATPNLYVYYLYDRLTTGVISLGRLDQLGVYECLPVLSPEELIDQ